MKKYTEEQLVKILEKEPMAREANEALQRLRKNRARRERHAALTSLGLKRVKGALGGVYYE